MKSPIAYIAASLLTIATTATLAHAQFPRKPDGTTILDSKVKKGARLSYKENNICETTENVHSYSGYIHFSPNTFNDSESGSQDYPINTFFWFFEARKDPQNAPLAIWINGGPGGSSMLGALAENGPCYIHADSNSTYLNEWSWNNEVNMLYIDQPAQVGFSYDTLANFTKDLSGPSYSPINGTGLVPEQNSTLLTGTFASRNGTHSPRGVRNTAKIFWDFMQVFAQDFPGYQSNNSRIALTTESFGGRWAPEFAAYIEQQNQKIAKGQLNNDHVVPLNLDTLLIINGCADRLTMWPTYPRMASNNTYGIKSLNDSAIEKMTDAIHRPGGCLDKVQKCHEAARVWDPNNLDGNDSVNAICADSETFCYDNILQTYRDLSGRNYFDIGTLAPSPTPPNFHLGFLNQPHIQQALGVPVNWTVLSGPIKNRFSDLGAYPRDASLENMAYLLDNGVKVALMYGDRDMSCNWYGGEQVSLAIPHSEKASFHAAGYTPLQTNSTYIGGQVREHGNLSFSRVYQAGHEVPFYQPETAYRIFMRALFGHDIATGKTEINPGYSSSGPQDTYDIQNEPAKEQPLQFCYTLDQKSCSDEQLSAIKNGTATICSFLLKDRNTTQLFPGIVGSLDEASCPGA